MPRETTEIRIDERGDETHESWVLIRANHVQGGARLFDSEVNHQHFVTVEVSRCVRKRELKRDRLFAREMLLGLEMSQAQWGAFVSSFGQGDGVPATLSFLAGDGPVPGAPPESRLSESFREVREAGEEALASVEWSYAAVMEAFEHGGKRAQREALRDLGIRLGNAPKNMEFAAKSMAEHVENVVTKARADIEGMVLSAQERGALGESAAVFELESGEERSS